MKELLSNEMPNLDLIKFVKDAYIHPLDRKELIIFKILTKSITLFGIQYTVWAKSYK